MAYVLPKIVPFFLFSYPFQYAFSLFFLLSSVLVFLYYLINCIIVIPEVFAWRGELRKKHVLKVLRLNHVSPFLFISLWFYFTNSDLLSILGPSSLLLQVW